MTDLRNMPNGSYSEWQGYTMKIGERDMIWVSKDGSNPMPGACCFKTCADARKGIAALVLANAICAPNVPGAPSKGDVFWSLLELNR